MYEHSAAHCHAVSQLKQVQASQPVNAQLSSQLEAEQSKARQALMKILSSEQYLARLGLAFRAHDHCDGNLWQLLQLQSEDVPQLKSWLKKVTNFTSPESQNEILTLINHEILRKIYFAIHNESIQYAVVMDGSQDMTGTEQEAICIRYVDTGYKDLQLQPAGA